MGYGLSLLTLTEPFGMALKTLTPMVLVCAKETMSQIALQGQQSTTLTNKRPPFHSKNSSNL